MGSSGQDRGESVGHTSPQLSSVRETTRQDEHPGNNSENSHH